VASRATTRGLCRTSHPAAACTRDASRGAFAERRALLLLLLLLLPPALGVGVDEGVGGAQYPVARMWVPQSEGRGTRAVTRTRAGCGGTRG
jgi:hypothetical protein